MKTIPSMPILKRLTALLLLLAAVFPVSAQSYYINVYQKDGKTLKLPVNDVDSIRFVLENEAPASVRYVDLGLSVMWADCNLGATSPYETGDYFSYGEISPKEKYTSQNYKFKNPDISGGFTKYNFYSKYGPVDYKYRLDMEDDAARVNWGPDWRMPTIEELQELVNRCYWEWTESENGVSGYTVTGPNGNSIFLISGGYMNQDENDVSCNSYLSSSLDFNNHGHALGLDFAENYYEIYPEGRYYGELIRPVYSGETPANTISITHFSLKESEITLSVGDRYQLHFDMDSLPVSPLLFAKANNSLMAYSDGTIIAYAPGTTTIEANLGEYISQCVVTVLEPQIVAEAVDLGLSVNWATCNLGAESPEKDGYYYAWGETQPKKDYILESYKWYDPQSDSYTKYITDSQFGNVDGKTVLDAEDDAVREYWGGSWRMPSSLEFQELINLCHWELTTINGVEGYKVSSLIEGYEDNWIFIPITGCKVGTTFFEDEEGYYWTNTVNNDDQTMADYLYLDRDYMSVWHYYRYQGRSIRAVTPSDTWNGITSIKLDNDTIAVPTVGKTTIGVRLLSGNTDYSFMGGIIWSSDNPDVASVDENGTVTTSDRTGIANITASINGLEATCVVVVTEKTAMMKADEVLALMKAFAPVSGSRHDDMGYPSVMMFTDANGMDVVQKSNGYNWSGTSLELQDRNNAYYAPLIMWQTLYGEITAANNVIKEIDTSSADASEQFALAQMLALRAFAYWNLAQLYQFNYAGNENKPCVPLITEVNADDAIANGCPRATVAEVYTQIMNDLNNAIGILGSAKKLGLSRPDKAHVDLSVAYGLRARVNLTMGEWRAAAADAQSAIDESSARPSSMIEASRPAFWTADEPDWMWGIIINEDDDVVQTGLVNYPSHMGSFNYGYNQYNGGRRINKALYNSISSTDVRKGWWLDTDYYSANLNDEQLNYIWQNGFEPYTQVKFAPYDNVLGTDINANDIPLMRIEEMYLILAEGQAMSGSTAQAKSVLESFIRSYRDSAYVCPDVAGTELQDEIWRQRRIELWGEGLSWFDIMRLGKDLDRRGAGYPDSHNVFNIPAGSDILLWTIPARVIESNPLISEDDNNPKADAPEPVDDFGSGITMNMMTGSYMMIYHSYFDNNTNPDSRDTLFCSIELGQSNTLIIKDLLFEGSEIVARFDASDGTLSISDWQYLGRNSTYEFYFTTVDINSITFICSPDGSAVAFFPDDGSIDSMMGIYAMKDGEKAGFYDASYGNVYLEPYGDFQPGN